MSYLDFHFLGNAGLQWLIAVGLGLGAFFGLLLVRAVALKQLRSLADRTRTPWDDLIVAALEQTKTSVIFVVAAFAGAMALTLPGPLRVTLLHGVRIALIVQGGLWASAAVMFWLGVHQKRRHDDSSTRMTMGIVGFLTRLALWSFVTLLVFDNLGVDITALVAGLGVGGVAVALAVQNVLGDLFASLSIVLDKPFVLDDFIIVDDLMGNVENIGIKTTRVRSLSGEQLVFSNADLLGSRIRNYGRMAERRVVMTLGVEYGIPKEKLEKVPGYLEEIVKKHENVRFARSHFSGYGDFSLNFETVYFILDPDYATYMDVQQSVNFAVYDRFEREGIGFAFPTQTLHVAMQSPSSQSQ